jgi:hypothetical protein
MLEFATTEELITELYKRQTFVGVVIRSKTEHKYAGQKITHNHFDVFDGTGGNLEPILRCILNELKENNCQERTDQE